MSAPVTAELNRESVLAKCEYFLEVQLWPLKHTLDPERWLSNFTAAESEPALHLLNAFMYFSQALLDRLFLAAFQSLSSSVRRPGDSFLAAQSRWRHFADQVIITRVTGETPNDTDSGYHFARMARQVLGLPQEQILGPEATMRKLLKEGPTPVVFVDDFVGGGIQFGKTWSRQYQINGSGLMSFEQIGSLLPGTEFYYCPPVCTAYGRRKLKAKCPSVIISPAHLLPDSYSVLAADSTAWPDHLRTAGPAFVEEASKRAGIPDPDWRGFHDLGLAIAFEHSVPDATLPIFHWNENGWKPLVERT